MSVKKRGDAWQVTVCWRGQVYRRSSRHWSREQAHEVKKQILDGLHDASLGKKPRRTFDDALERYEREELPKMKPRTQSEARKNIRYIRTDISGRYLDEAKDVAGELQAKFSGKSPATINRRVQIVARLCSLALHWEWIDRQIPIPMLPEQHRDNFLTKAQVEKLAKAMGGANGDFVRLLAYTGIRKGQALALNRGNVRGGYLYLGRDGKTGRPQVVPVHPNVKGIVKRLPLPVTLGTLHKAWYRATASTGIQARIHDLRHTLASWMLQGGADLIAVRDMLGHSSVAVTQRYAHLAAKHLQRAVRRI